MPSLREDGFSNTLVYFFPLIYISLWMEHFTVLCSVARPSKESEAGVDLALIQTSLLFLCKSCCCNANEFLFT